MTARVTAGHRSVSVVLLFSSPLAGEISQPTSETLLLHTGENTGRMDELRCKHVKPEEDFFLGRYGPAYAQCIVI